MNRHDSISAGGAVNNRLLSRNSAGQVASLAAANKPNYVMRYAYDGHGRRVIKSRNGEVYTVYDAGGKLRYREDSVSGVTSEYLYIAGELIMRRDNGNSSDGGGTDPNPVTRTSNATDFRATAHSSTSAELYWTAANDPKHGRATEYVIYRNGRRLQETSNSSSLWLSGMPRGEVLTFQIVAIYASGARSEKSDAITLRMSAQEQSY